MLHMLQEQRKGRVLSCPVVVTLNGLEIKMSSGSQLSIRLASDTNAKLQQIQTGTIPRVTPRWIEPVDSVRCRLVFTQKPAHRCRTMRLMVFPRSIARSSLMVSNGQHILMEGMIHQQSSNSTQGAFCFRICHCWAHSLD